MALSRAFYAQLAKMERIKELRYWKNTDSELILLRGLAGVKPKNERYTNGIRNLDTTKLEWLRKERGIPGIKLSRALGKSDAYYSQIRGLGYVSEADFQALRQYFGVRESELSAD